jgi:hypothetical protein
VGELSFQSLFCWNIRRILPNKELNGSDDAASIYPVNIQFGYDPLRNNSSLAGRSRNADKDINNAQNYICIQWSNDFISVQFL